MNFPHYSVKETTRLELYKVSVNVKRHNIVLAENEGEDKMVDDDAKRWKIWIVTREESTVTKLLSPLLVLFPLLMSAEQ